MDKELLDTLSNLFDKKLKPIIESQVRLEKKLDAVVEQTADLTEFRTEMKDFSSKTHIQLEDI
jgi:flagellar capping protein FliD